MINQRYTPQINYFSVFTSKQDKQKAAQKRVSESTKSQFYTSKSHRGTSGTSVFISMNSRRKYKYNEK